MKLRRLATLLLAPAAGIVLAIAVAAPASAVTIDQKLAVMSSWSQPTTASYNAWNAARQNQGAWTSYGFDWSTDYCSDSPDQPLGFDFRIPCWHHDFGYRNYRAVGQFPANKDRIDSYLYFDLKAKCATYNVFTRPACYSLAWTYYQAVQAFGSLAVSQSDLNKAAVLKASGERAQQAAAAKAAKVAAAH
jgi:Prokaryotic phospholipase A2